jgi:hypothetical protein
MEEEALSDGFYTIKTDSEARDINVKIKAGGAGFHDFKALEIYLLRRKITHDSLGIDKEEVERHFAALRSKAVEEAKQCRDDMKNGTSKSDTRNRFWDLINNFAIRMHELPETKKNLVLIFHNHARTMAEEVIQSLEGGCDQLYMQELMLNQYLSEAMVTLEDFLAGRNTTLADWNAFLRVRYRGELRRLQKEVKNHPFNENDGLLREMLSFTELRIKELEA